MKNKKTHLWINIDIELKKKIMKLAEADNRTLSAYIKLILIDYLENKWKNI